MEYLSFRNNSSIMYFEIYVVLFSVILKMFCLVSLFHPQHKQIQSYQVHFKTFYTQTYNKQLTFSTGYFHLWANNLHILSSVGDKVAKLRPATDLDLEPVHMILSQFNVFIVNLKKEVLFLCVSQNLCNGCVSYWKGALYFQYARLSIFIYLTIWGSCNEWEGLIHYDVNVRSFKRLFTNISFTATFRNIILPKLEAVSLFSSFNMPQVTICLVSSVLLQCDSFLLRYVHWSKLSVLVHCVEVSNIRDEGKVNISTGNSTSPLFLNWL